MTGPFPRIIATRKTGAEPLHSASQPLGPTLSDFWAWGGSELVSNTSRGAVAEFIVATSLGCDLTGIRDEWRPYDLDTPEGLKVEVKSAAYLQAWHQKGYSRISFGAGASRAFDPVTGRLDKEPRRHADVYVFALHAHKDQETLDPLDVSQWRFYVLPATRLPEKQRSVTKEWLETQVGPAVCFDGLRQAVKASAVRPA